MELPLELENWLTEAGDVVVRKRASGGVLSQREQLLFEIWALDTETRNGGLSQYFANRGLAQWNRCEAACAGKLPSFMAFAKRVEAIISGKTDPYQALIECGTEADDLYYEYQTQIVRELQSAFNSTETDRASHEGHTHQEG